MAKTNCYVTVTDELNKIFDGCIQNPPNLANKNDYDQLYIATLISFSEIIGKSSPHKIIGFAQELCNKIVNSDILNSNSDGVCEASLKLLTSVVCIQMKNIGKRSKSICFWKSMIAQGLNTKIQVILSDACESTYEKSRKSEKQLNAWEK